MIPVKRYLNAWQGTFANNGLSDAAIFLRPGSGRTPKNWMRVKARVNLKMIDRIFLIG